MIQMKGGTQWEQPRILSHDTYFLLTAPKKSLWIISLSVRHSHFLPQASCFQCTRTKYGMLKTGRQLLPQPRFSFLWETASGQGAQFLQESEAFPPSVLASATALDKLKGLALHSEKGTSTDRSCLPPWLSLSRHLQLEPGCVFSVLQALAISYLSLVGSALVCLCPELSFGNVCFKMHFLSCVLPFAFTLLCPHPALELLLLSGAFPPVSRWVVTPNPDDCLMEYVWEWNLSKLPSIWVL